MNAHNNRWPISDCSSEGLKAAVVLALLDAKKVVRGA